MIYKITPCPKPRMTQSDKWKKRPAVMRYRAFCDELRAAGAKLGDAVYLSFMMPMPASWSQKKRDKMRGQPHQQKPDIDNLQKAVLDALLDDDSKIYFLVGLKYWADEGSIEIKDYEKP